MSKYNKVETEAGYPCYIDNANNQQCYDHPQFRLIWKSLEKYNELKYSTYRVAFKVFELQKQLKVPPLRITSGVFARHQLSLSESSLSLDTAELEAVLADIYFAAEKEGVFSGDVDLNVDLMINLLLNIYDAHRTTPIRVLAVKSLLILLSEENVLDKWQALANCCADHNGCVSPRRLVALLNYVTALPRYLGINCDDIQTDVDACFDKSAGMLGVSARVVAEWAVQYCASARWLPVLQRIFIRRAASPSAGSCSACNQLLAQVLHFKCSKCRNVYFCENCYLYDKNMTLVSGHKKTHVVHEIIDDEVNPPECLGFVKRFFFCTSTRKKKTTKKDNKKQGTVKQKNSEKKSEKIVSAPRKGKPAIFTSTVGKASGNSDPTMTLQDIINQLETRNTALKELLENNVNPEEDLKVKVDSHYSLISAQIDRLKLLKENLTQTNIQDGKTDKNSRPQAFDLFSPIPVEEKVSRIPDAQPRVLSMDSGNFSVVSKQTEVPRMTMSGDELKPVLVHAASDSISAVSVGDVSNWYNATAAVTREFERSVQGGKPECLALAERRFDDDIRSVETSNDKMRELNADLDTVLDRLQQILTNNFATDESCFDNSQLRETASEMEGLLGSLIRGVEQRATLNATKALL